MSSTDPIAGWNDPPIVKFEVAVASKKSNLLKKRATNEESKPETSALKEESINNTPSACESEGNGSEISEVVDLSDEEILQFVVNTFQSVLNETSNKNERTVIEINRRINMMKEAWNSKLSKEVKEQMLQLAKELSKGQIDAALKIHWHLMMQYVREVKSWMVGVKHIIEMKKENTLSETVEKVDSSSSS